MQIDPSQVKWDEPGIDPAKVKWDAPDIYKQTAERDSNGTNLLAAIGGAMKAPYLGVKQMLGKTDPGEIEDYKRSMEGLWSTPAGKIGTVAGGGSSRRTAGDAPRG
jgi:hypothetical protein